MSFIDNFRHYLVLTSIGYISGLLLIKFSEPVFTFYIIIFLIIFLNVIIIKLIIYLKKRKHFPKIMSLSLLFIIPLITGSIRLYLWNNESLKILHTLEYDNAIYTCKITSIPERTSNNTYMTNALLFKIRNNANEKEVNMNIRLFFNETSFESISLGDTIKFYTQYHPKINNYAIYQKGRNQVATLSANRCIKVHDADVPFNAAAFISVIGVNIQNLVLTAIDKIYSYNPESAAVIKAILTGNKSGFSNYLYDAFKDSGFLHVAAISGMHVSILFSILSVFLLNIRINKKLSILVSAAIIILFSSVASFTPSVLRAAIMLILSNFSILVNKEYDSLTALFFSALIILIIYPFALFTSGFLLSFGATLGLIVFYKHFSKGLKKLFGKFSSILMTDSIAISISAFLGTAPFSLLFFGDLSLWSLVTNIWIVPLVYIVFCLGLISCVFYYIYPPVAFVLRFLNEPCTYIIIKTAKIFSDFKFIVISPDYIPWCFYIFYSGLFFILVYLLKKQR